MLIEPGRGFILRTLSFIIWEYAGQEFKESPEIDLNWGFFGIPYCSDKYTSFDVYSQNSFHFFYVIRYIDTYQRLFR